LTINPSDIQVPDTIQGIIAARMDRLEDNLKRTMQVASVIGRDFAYRILQTITGMREELKSYLLNLQGLEFIYEKNLFPELEYIFKHALTQEVAYNSLLLKRRKDIHERIGNAIEELYPDRLEEFYEVLAHHYSRSDNSEKAYQYLFSSMVKTGLRFSLCEAFRFGKEAVNVLNNMPQTDENKVNGIIVRLILAMIMNGLGYPKDSLQILQDGERLSRELGDERNLINFYSSLGLYYVSNGDLPQGMKHAEKAFQGAERLGDIELLAPIVCSLCWVYVVAGGFPRIVEVAPKVIASLEETHRESEYFGRPFTPYSALLAQCGSALGWLGNFWEGEELCDKALRFAMETGNFYNIAEAEFAYGLLLNIKGDGENAIQHAKNALKYCEETQFNFLLAGAWLILGQGHALIGELEKAIEYIEKGLEIQRDSGFSPFLSFFYIALGHFHLESGDLTKARNYIEKVLGLSQRSCERYNEGMARVLLGSILGKTDPLQRDKAEQYILEGIAILDEMKLKPWSATGYLSLGELYADMGQKKKALETLKKAEGMMQEMGMDYWLRRTQGVLERVQGKIKK